MVITHTPTACSLQTRVNALGSATTELEVKKRYTCTMQNIQVEDGLPPVGLCFPSSAIAPFDRLVFVVGLFFSPCLLVYQTKINKYARM